MSGLEIFSVKERDGCTRVTPGRDIVASMAPDLRKALLTVAEKEPGDIILDLTGVEMVDSVGLGVLIAAYNSVSKGGGKLVFVNTTNDVVKLFKMMRLDKHFTIVSQ
ncbi:MAG: STAS domain-containing protein [Syntrophobacteraceae bacterium]